VHPRIVVVSYHKRLVHLQGRLQLQGWGVKRGPPIDACVSWSPRRTRGELSIRTIETGTGWLVRQDAQRYRGGSKTLVKSTVNSDDLPGSGEHYLDPARIDAKGSETRLSRRGDAASESSSLEPLDFRLHDG
jgi:hypothetical protein